MSIFGALPASAQSAGGQSSAKSASIFGAAGASSTGGKEEAQFGSGGVGGGRGGGTFGSTEKSAPLAARQAAPAAPAAAAPPPPVTAAQARQASVEEATRVPAPPDMKAMAPKKNGDTNDIKALLAQLNQAATSEVKDYTSDMAIEVDHEVPMTAYEDLREMTTLLLKLESPKEGGGGNRGKTIADYDGPEIDTDKFREDTLRETMKSCQKASTRESDHSKTK